MFIDRRFVGGTEENDPLFLHVGKKLGRQLRNMIMTYCFEHLNQVLKLVRTTTHALKIDIIYGIKIRVKVTTKTANLETIK